MMNQAWIRFLRQTHKSLISTCVLVALSLFLLFYNLRIEDFSSKISEIACSIPTKAYWQNPSTGERNELAIPIKDILQMEQSGFVASSEMMSLLWYLPTVRDTFSEAHTIVGIDRPDMMPQVILTGIGWLDGYDKTIFIDGGMYCVVEISQLIQNDWHVGDAVQLDIYSASSYVNVLGEEISINTGWTIVGTFADAGQWFGSRNCSGMIICPFSSLRDAAAEGHNKDAFTVSSASYLLANTDRLDDLRALLDAGNMENDSQILFINDTVLQNAIRSLQENRMTMIRLRAVVIIVTVFFAFLSSILFVVNGKRNFAIMRLLGQTKKSVVETALLEQGIICIVVLASVTVTELFTEASDWVPTLCIAAWLIGALLGILWCCQLRIEELFGKIE